MYKNIQDREFKFVSYEEGKKRRGKHAKTSKEFGSSDGQKSLMMDFFLEKENIENEEKLLKYVENIDQQSLKKQKKEESHSALINTSVDSPLLNAPPCQTFKNRISDICEVGTFTKTKKSKNALRISIPSPPTSLPNVPPSFEPPQAFMLPSITCMSDLEHFNFFHRSTLFFSPLTSPFIENVPFNLNHYSGPKSP